MEDSSLINVVGTCTTDIMSYSVNDEERIACFYMKNISISGKTVYYGIHANMDKMPHISKWDRIKIRGTISYVEIYITDNGKEQPTIYVDGASVQKLPIW